jgi:hypothetical protein
MNRTRKREEKRFLIVSVEGLGRKRKNVKAPNKFEGEIFAHYSTRKKRKEKAFTSSTQIVIIFRKEKEGKLGLLYLNIERKTFWAEFKARFCCVTVMVKKKGRYLISFPSCLFSP